MRSRSASLPVTPSSLDSMSIRNPRKGVSSQARDEPDGGDARQETISRPLRRNEREEPGHLDCGRAIWLRDHEDAVGWILASNHRIFRFGMQANRPGEFAVIDPLAQHELILVLNVGVDEIAEQPA